MKLIKNDFFNPNSRDMFLQYRNEQSFFVKTRKGVHNFDHPITVIPGLHDFPTKAANVKILVLKRESLDQFLNYYRNINITINIDVATFGIIEAEQNERTAEIRRFMERENGFNLINGTLRGFQKKGVGFVRYKKRVILADDMGLGKTVQAIEFLLRERSDGVLTKALIVVPASIKTQWRQEIERFRNDTSFTVQVIDGNVEQRADQWRSPAMIFIVNYETLTNDLEYGYVIPDDFSHIIVDEASYIKNYAAKRSKTVKKVGVNAVARVAMTGTPLENNIEELWSIGNFVDPDMFGSRNHFRQRFKVLLKRNPRPTEIHERDAELADLRAMLSKVMIRRRKADVLSELPPLTITEQSVQLDPVAQVQHDLLKAKLRDLLHRYQGLEGRTDGEANQVAFALSKQILAKLTLMREICLMPELVIEDEHATNTKLNRLKEIIDEIADENKIIIFTEFRRVAEMLHREIPNSVIVHGGINKMVRPTIIDDFKNSPEKKVLISTSVLQFGVNLQFANYVINYDLHYNPAKMAQRIDRLYRMGQLRPVTVINLLTTNSIEENIEMILVRKYNLFCAVIEGRQVEANFTRTRFIDDIAAVLDMHEENGRVILTTPTTTVIMPANQARELTISSPRRMSKFEPEYLGQFDAAFVRKIRLEARDAGEQEYWRQCNEEALEMNMNLRAWLGEMETQFLECLEED